MKLLPPSPLLRRCLTCLILSVLIQACTAYAVGETTLPQPSPTITRQNTPTRMLTFTPKAPPDRTPTALPVLETRPASPTPATECAPNPITASVLQQLTPDSWITWVRRLSGDEPVRIGGWPATIKTRFTTSMFQNEPTSAFQYVLETLRGWYPDGQIQTQSFTRNAGSGPTISGKNLILTLPGASRPDEEVILSAHLDSISRSKPETLAPGAEDNASGSAALLEAARLLKEHTFERTVRIIWFTGEEEGLLGSQAYLKERETGGKLTGQIIGVVNLDMFGYDADGDHCFEIHAGTLPASDRVGQCFTHSIQSYALELPRFDYLTDGATDRSDHGSFWNAQIGAVEILENLLPDTGSGQPNACGAQDRSPYYHTDQDTVDRLDPQTGAAITRAAIATIMDLAIAVK